MHIRNSAIFRGDYSVPEAVINHDASIRQFVPCFTITAPSMAFYEGKMRREQLYFGMRSKMTDFYVFLTHTMQVAGPIAILTFLPLAYPG